MEDKKGFGQRLRAFRKDVGLTQKELAVKIGVSAQVISNWERGYTTGVDTNALSSISEVLGCSVDYLLDRKQVLNVVDAPKQTVAIPILGVIKAGEPMFAIENIEGYEHVDSKEAANGEFFYLRVSGDSMMNARIYDGDLVYVRQQPDVESGEIAVVLVNGYEATLKRVLKADDSIILQPENPKYKPMVFDRKKIESGYIERVLLVVLVEGLLVEHCLVRSEC